MMKLLFPNGEANEEEADELIDFAIEGRKRVKDQLMRIDPTYSPVKFGYKNLTAETSHRVKTLEETEYPGVYKNAYDEKVPDSTEENDTADANSEDKTANIALKPKEIRIPENQKGISYKALFGDDLKEAKEIKITDPYIRAPFQIRNLTE